MSPALAGPSALWTIKDRQADVEKNGCPSWRTCHEPGSATTAKPSPYSLLTALGRGAHPHFTDKDAEARSVQVPAL